MSNNEAVNILLHVKNGASIHSSDIEQAFELAISALKNPEAEEKEARYAEEPSAV